MEKLKKKMTHGLYTVLIFLLGILLLISVNFCASKLTERFDFRFDMTDNSLYRLSEQTLDILENLENPIKVRVISSEEDFLPLVSELLYEYSRKGNGNIDLAFVDPYTNPTVLDGYLRRGLQVDVGSVVVEGEIYVRAIALEDMFETDKAGKRIESLKCEQQLTSAILYAAGRKNPAAVFTAGHNESVSAALRDLFVRNNYQVSDITLSMADIPSESKLALIAAPSGDFTPDEISRLDAFMSRGGSLMVFLKPNADELPNLSEFLVEWGIKATGISVAEPLQYVEGKSVNIVPIYSVHEINRYFSHNQIYIIMPSAQALETAFVSQAGIRTQKLLYSTDRAYDVSDPAGAKGPFTLAISAEKKLPEGKARVFAAGSRGMYDDGILEQAGYGNAQFLTQVMNWCVEADSSVSIQAKRLNDRVIAITGGQILALSLIFIVILPLGALLWGIFTHYRRQRS